MNDINKRIVLACQKKIVNEDVFKDRDITGAVVGAVSKIKNKITLLGYSRRVPHPRDIWELIMWDHIEKTSEKKRHLLRKSIDLNKSKVDELNLYYMINENLLNDNERARAPQLLANTFHSIHTMYNDGVVDTLLENNIPECPQGYVNNNGDNLIIKIVLYVPRIINSMYMDLNGRKYYNGYYMTEKKLTSKGELEVEHKTHTAYMGINSTGFITHRVYSEYYNPFDFMCHDPEFKSLVMGGKVTQKKATQALQGIFPDFYINENQRAIDAIERTFMAFDQNASKLKTIDTDGTVRFNDKDVQGSEIKYAIQNLFNDQSHDIFDLHKTLVHYTRKDFMDKLSKMRRGNLETLRSRIKIKPNAVLSIIKTYKQFTSNDSTNEIDLDQVFSYTRTLNSSQFREEFRKFRRKELAVCDPIATAQSNNVGITGQLCYSIPSDRLKNSI